MKVRLLLPDEAMPASRRHNFRVAEYLFLFAGLLALDYYVWVNASASLAQAYESWSFEQDLKGHPASTKGFAKNELDALTGKKESINLPPPPVALAPAKPQVPPITALKSEIRAPKPEAVLGRVLIPRLGLTVMIREGVDTGTLRHAVGHVPSTALPGQIGNVALAAHRDTYFRPLEHIENGDVIQVQTLSGTYEYAVDSLRIVTPKDVWVLKASGTKPTLTLVTCYPFHFIGSAPKRFIVRATQITPGSTPKQEAEVNASSPPQGF